MHAGVRIFGLGDKVQIDGQTYHGVYYAMDEYNKNLVSKEDDQQGHRSREKDPVGRNQGSRKVKNRHKKTTHGCQGVNVSGCQAVRPLIELKLRRVGC